MIISLPFYYYPAREVGGERKKGVSKKSRTFLSKREDLRGSRKCSSSPLLLFSASRGGRGMRSLREGRGGGRLF